MTYSVRIIASLLFSLMLVSTAQAHMFAPSLLKIVETEPQLYRVVWKTPSKIASSTPLLPGWPHGCALSAQSPALREGTGIITSWIMDCKELGSTGLVGQKLSISGLAENQASALVILELQDGRHYQSVLNGDNQDFVVPALVPAAPEQSGIMKDYSVLGFEHIWSGLDHLMFVFGLLLLVGVGSQLIWTITAFTVGHSITLALITLGLLSYPVALIEFAIALSIFVLALELAKKGEPAGKPGLINRFPWLMAGGFGLLHGMGFAGALVEIGLPQNHVLLALLFFNIGIEVGQIVFVLVLVCTWWLVRTALKYLKAEAAQKQLLPIPVYLLGGLAAMWCIERGIELIA